MRTDRTASPLDTLLGDGAPLRHEIRYGAGASTVATRCDDACVLRETEQYFGHLRVDEARVDRTLSIIASDRLRRACIDLVRGMQPVARVRSHVHLAYERFDLADGSKIFVAESVGAHVVVRAGAQLALVGSSTTTLGHVAVRLLRQVMVRTMEGSGGVVVHASSVGVDGRGVVFVGQGGAGKTTLACHLMALTNASYVANDRTLVHPRGDTLVLTGVPLSMRVTGDTIARCTPLHEAFTHGFTPRRDATRSHDGKIELTPNEVARLFDVEIAATIPLRAVVLLKRRDTSAEINEPVVVHAGQAIVDQCYTPCDPAFPDDWLRLRDVDERRLRQEARTLIATVVEQVPTLDVAWSPAERPGDVAARVLRLLTTNPVC